MNNELKNFNMKKNYIKPNINVIPVDMNIMSNFQSGFNVDGNHGGDVIDPDSELPWGEND